MSNAKKKKGDAAEVEVPPELDIPLTEDQQIQKDIEDGTVEVCIILF